MHIDCQPQFGLAAGEVEFVGLRFAQTSLSEMVDAASKRAAGDPFLYVVTPNVDHVVRLASSRQGAELKAAYEGAWLRVCDSRVLARLARLFGVKLSVVPGSDLTAHLLGRLTGSGRRIAVIGADPASIERLGNRFPGIEFVHHEPPMGLLGNPAAMAEAAAFAVHAQADFVLLAVGSPQQEILANAIHAHAGSTGTGLCIGASIDFLTGRARRAPRIMQRLGLEWAYRLFGEPRRMWRRYLVEGPRILGIVLTWRYSRIGTGS